MSSMLESSDVSLEAHFLGQIELERCVALQQRLVDEAATRGNGQISLLLCEHPQLITVGRSGSPGEIQYGAGPLRHGQIDVRWVKRGGGCLVHGPGQLAVYPIVPLADHGWTVGEYLDRLQTGIQQALTALKIRTETRPPEHGLWGRTGQLVALGTAVSRWIAYHGAFVNVCPAMGMFRLIDADPLGDARMGTLVAERGQRVRMTSVRAELVRQLADVFGCRRSHLYTGHPWLARSQAFVH